MKKIVALIFVAVVAIVAAWNFTQKDVVLTDLVSENIEALAQNEGSSPYEHGPYVHVLFGDNYCMNENQIDCVIWNSRKR